MKIISENEALNHRMILEKTEKKIGNLHYKSKVHTILKSPYELATNKARLEAIRKKIKVRFNSPFSNSYQFTRDLESIYSNIRR